MLPLFSIKDVPFLVTAALFKIAKYGIFKISVLHEVMEAFFKI